jgi:hypothetical protein
VLWCAYPKRIQSTILDLSLHFLLTGMLTMAKQPHVCKQWSDGFLPFHPSYGVMSLFLAIQNMTYPRIWLPQECGAITSQIGRHRRASLGHRRNGRSTSGLEPQCFHRGDGSECHGRCRSPKPLLDPAKGCICSPWHTTWPWSAIGTGTKTSDLDSSTPDSAIPIVHLAHHAATTYHSHRDLATAHAAHPTVVVFT